MPPVGKAALSFTLPAFEQAMDRRSMHRDGIATPRLSGRYSLLDVSDDLSLSGLARLWGYGGLHDRTPFSFFIALVGVFISL
jgi:hypothetical protein